MRNALLLAGAGALGLALIAGSVALDLLRIQAGADLFTEQSMIEASHLLLLLVSACFVGACAARGDGPVAWTLALMYASFLVREADHWLDRYVFDGAWQTIVAMLGMVNPGPRREPDRTS